MGKSIKRKLSKQSRKVIRNKNISKSKRSSRKKKVSRKSSSNKRKKSKRSRRKKKVMRGGIVINDMKNNNNISFFLDNVNLLTYDEQPYLSFNKQKSIKKVLVKTNSFQPKTNRKKSLTPIYKLTSTNTLEIGEFNTDGTEVTLDGTTYNVGNIKAEKEYLTETDETYNILSTVYYITITKADESTQ